jgi:hypothetical protein
VLHVSSRTWNNTEYHSYNIGTPSVADEGLCILLNWWYVILRVDQWYAILWVLSVNVLFQSGRARRNKVFRGHHAEDTDYDPETPDYTRWLEYALTSPVQVFLVAVNVGLTQDELLWMLMGTQALLMLLGYLVELCMWLKWSAATAATAATAAAPQGTPGVVPAAVHGWGPGKGSGPAKGSALGIMPAHLPAETHLFRVGCAAAADCPDDRHPADVSLKQRYVFGFVVSGFMWHCTIWCVLVTAFWRSERQFNRCQQQQVPEFVKWLLWTQCALFTVFGVVQLAMVLIMKRHNARGVWRDGSMCYSILSVTAKTTLDILFIAGAAMAE